MSQATTPLGLTGLIVIVATICPSQITVEVRPTQALRVDEFLMAPFKNHQVAAVAYGAPQSSSWLSGSVEGRNQRRRPRQRIGVWQVLSPSLGHADGRTPHAPNRFRVPVPVS
jgi:hypothetical protein